MESPVGPPHVDTSYKFKLRPRERNKKTNKHNKLTSKAFASPPAVPHQPTRRLEHVGADTSTSSVESPPELKTYRQFLSPNPNRAKGTRSTSYGLRVSPLPA